MNRNTSLTYVLRALESFHKGEGHSCVPSGHIEQELRLGDAVDHLRKLRAEGALPAAVSVRIQSHTGWYWARGDSPIHRFIGAVGGYISLHGHTRFKPGSKLESLAAGIREELEQGTLDRDVFLALQSFPQWRWDLTTDRGWADRFRELAALSDEQGHCRLSVEAGRSQLASWATAQRKRFRAGELEPSRRYRMEMLRGWTWQPSHGIRERYVTELEDYVRDHGSANVPPAYVTEDGFPLGSALGRVRRLQSRGELSARRISALEAVPGWKWDSGRIHQDKAAEAVRNLRAFVDREGHAEVPVHHVEDGFRLGAYLTQSRSRLRGGKISKTRVEQLDAVHPGWRRGALSPHEEATDPQGDHSLAA
jgi:hypothetical protein